MGFFGGGGGGAIVAPSVTLTPVTFANLPAAPVRGMIATVTDSTVRTLGAPIAGGGTNTVEAFYTGSAWVVDTPSIPPDFSCRLQHSNDQSVPNATGAIVTWDVEQYDTANMHDPAVNPSRITVPVAGKYWVSAALNWTGFQATGARAITFTKNGVSQSSSSMVVTTGTTFIQQNNALIDANAGDYFEVFAFQSSGAALLIYGNVTSGQGLGAPFFSAIKIGG